MCQKGDFAKETADGTAYPDGSLISCSGSFLHESDEPLKALMELAVAASGSGI